MDGSVDGSKSMCLYTLCRITSIFWEVKVVCVRMIVKTPEASRIYVINMIIVGPDRWSELAPAARGLHQSPVDLVARDVVCDPLIGLGPIRVRYVPASCRTMTNTGHGVQISLDEHNYGRGRPRYFKPRSQWRIQGGTQAAHPPHRPWVSFFQV